MAEYIITVRGEPVAILRPVTESDVRWLRDAEIEEELAELDALAREVAENWQSDRTGVELIEEQRRG